MVQGIMNIALHGTILEIVTAIQVLDPSVVDYECYIEYCYYWDTCQWETYDYICY